METVREKTEYLIKNKPGEIVKLMETWAMKMKDQANLALDLAIYGKHILTEDVYNKAMAKLEVKPKFDIDVLEEPMIRNINFDSKDYTVYDMLYIMNRLYMMYHDIVDSMEDYAAMAKACLEDKHYPGDPSEKAFYEVEKILYK